MKILIHGTPEAVCFVSGTHPECHFPSKHPVYPVWMSNLISIEHKEGLIWKRTAHAKPNFLLILSLTTANKDQTGKYT